MAAVATSEVAWQRAERAWYYLLQFMHGVYQRRPRLLPATPRVTPSVVDGEFIEPALGPILAVTEEDILNISEGEFRRLWQSEWGAEGGGKVGSPWGWESTCCVAAVGLLCVAATVGVLLWRKRRPIQLGGSGGGGGGGGGGGRGLAMVLENGGDDVIGGGGDGGGGGGDGRGEVVHRQRRITLPAGILLADANPQHEEQTRSLIRIAIYNISYIRGLFPEKYFTDKSALVVEMKINKLMHMDADSRSLIHWISKVSFSYPNSNGEEVAMNMSRTGIKKNSATFKSNAAEVTPDQMRCSACKMIRRLLRSLDPMPEKEMIEDVLEKLLSDDLLSRASKDGYAVIKISDPGTPYMEKEVSMHNVSPTDGANIDNGDLKCMKVKKPILQYQAPQVPAH